jgi:hypothetical protein
MANYTDQDIQNWFAANPDVQAPDVAKIMYEYGVSPEQVAQATGRDPQYVRNTYMDSLGLSSGLRPAFNTLGQGGQQATQRIGETQGQVGGLYQQGMNFLNPYMQQGQQANDLQSALSGAMGPEAQQQAFAQYQQSPGVAFAQKEAERALLRNASATGGLGGGNVLRDLTQLAAGTFMQDFGNQFNRIGTVADRGLSTATTGAGLQGQQAQVQAGLGQFAAGVPMRVSEGQSGMQFQAGRDIAQGVQSTSTALSNLINQQGAGMTDILGNTTTNINNLYQSALSGDANSKEQLAQILGNLSTNNASMISSQPIIQGQQTNYLGQLGQIAGGLGGLYAGMNSGQNSTTPQTSYMSAQDAARFGLYPGGGARLGGGSYGPYNTGYRMGQ